MPTLYELKGAYAQIQQMIVDGVDGLEDTLESIEGAIEEKIEAYVMVIRNLEADVLAYENEEKRFRERKQVAKNGIERMKKVIAETMAVSNREEVKTEKFNIKFRNNAPSVKIIDESLIPEEFIKIERTISRAELAKRLKETDIPGAKLVANKSLQIK